MAEHLGRVRGTLDTRVLAAEPEALPRSARSVGGILGAAPGAAGGVS